MKHNQKPSEAWNSVHAVLHQGRRLEPFEERTSKEYATSTLVGDNIEGDKLLPTGKLEQNGPLVDIYPTKVERTCFDDSAVELLVHASQEEQACNKTSIRFSIDEKHADGHQNSVIKAGNSSNGHLEKSCKEAMMIDILEISPIVLARLEPDKQATNCSSSFGDTQISLTDDEVDGRSCEVESELRDSNGSTLLSHHIPSSNRTKRAVNLEWKTYRQGIEWRCRWLELRVKELQALINKYSKIVSGRKSTMKQEPEQHESISARTSVIFTGSQQQALLRLQRCKEEEHADSRKHLSKHPVFSRYEKKQQNIPEGLANEQENKDDSYPILDFDDFHPDFDYGFGDEFLLEDDSIEQHLWQIESLQLHVCRLKNQLTRGSISYKNVPKDMNAHGGHALQQVCPYDTNTAASSPNFLGARSFLGGSKVKGGKSLARKRSSDFDPDSLMLPDTVMANYIEPARHAFIETPQWRVVADASVSARGGSSEEDSDDDDAYKKQSTQSTERLPQDEQDAPGSNCKGLSSMKQELCAEKESHVHTTDGASNGSVQNFSTSFGFVPKRKRRRRESRGNASVAKNIEPLLKASYDDSTDPCEYAGVAKDKDNHNTSSTV